MGEEETRSRNEEETGEEQKDRRSVKPSYRLEYIHFSGIGGMLKEPTCATGSSEPHSDHISTIECRATLRCRSRVEASRNLFHVLPLLKATFRQKRWKNKESAEIAVMTRI
jgi:hypothetical protein